MYTCITHNTHTPSSLPHSLAYIIIKIMYFPINIYKIKNNYLKPSYLNGKNRKRPPRQT